ncbi:MAG: biotin carboxylase [Lachnospiraceae bacterium]|nr:biotin carboxylase [Lachnospiraceae bacterium]
MYRNRKYIVFALDHYNPLGVIRSLGEAGIACDFIAVKHRMELGTKSKYVNVCHKVASVEEGYRVLLEQYGNQGSEKPFLITCDDRTTGYLDERYDELKDKFIFFNAGEKGRITKFMDKNEILECAKRNGLKVLDSVVVARGEIPMGLEYPVITKSISPNVGGWKSDVHICHSEEELKEAFEHIAAPTVLIQKYIEKKNEYCIDGFCINHGEKMFRGISSVYNYLIPGYYSPYMTVSNFPEGEMSRSLQGMMKEIGFEGVFSAEFLIDAEDNYWFCEINFRNSTWSYASTVAGMPLPVLWAQCMLDGEISESMYKEVPSGFTAMVEPVDYAKRVKTGKITLAEWMIAFKKTNCGYYYSADDVEPWRVCVENWGELG